jgi:transposase
MEAREAKALHIAATTRLEPDNGRWTVPSQSGDGHWSVVIDGDGCWVCDCPDYEARLAPCKHVKAVEITLRRENGGKAAPFSDVVKVTYSQDWKAYNAAQTNETALFLPLLADLCRVVEPWPRATGRPRMPRADMVFSLVYKVYRGLSARRFNSDLSGTEQEGHIDRLPSFNTVLRYMQSPELTQTLVDLVEVSSLPMRPIETDFAVDSSGFGTTRRVTWYSQKHGRELSAREWVKAHLLAGVRTHIVTAVEVSGWSANDAPFLPVLVERTAKRFTMSEVSADKGYLTKSNAQAVEDVGARPFIPFKSNSVRPAEGTAWSRMYHLYAYRRDEFLEHYHKRSNVETVFSMVKGKFGDGVLSRTDAGMVNEVLCKVIAHNVCVLIQSIYELGIEPDFGQAPTLDPEPPRLRLVKGEEPSSTVGGWQ